MDEISSSAHLAICISRSNSPVTITLRLEYWDFGHQSGAPHQISAFLWAVSSVISRCRWFQLGMMMMITACDGSFYGASAKAREFDESSFCSSTNVDEFSDGHFCSSTNVDKFSDSFLFFPHPQMGMSLVIALFVPPQMPMSLVIALFVHPQMPMNLVIALFVHPQMWMSLVIVLFVHPQMWNCLFAAFIGWKYWRVYSQKANCPQWPSCSVMGRQTDRRVQSPV